MRRSQKRAFTLLEGAAVLALFGMLSSAGTFTVKRAFEGSRGASEQATVVALAREGISEGVVAGSNIADLDGGGDGQSAAARFTARFEERGFDVVVDDIPGDTRVATLSRNFDWGLDVVGRNVKVVALSGSGVAAYMNSYNPGPKTPLQAGTLNASTSASAQAALPGRASTPGQATVASALRTIPQVEVVGSVAGSMLPVWVLWPSLIAVVGLGWTLLVHRRRTENRFVPVRSRSL